MFTYLLINKSSSFDKKTLYLYMFNIILFEKPNKNIIELSLEGFLTIQRGNFICPRSAYADMRRSHGRRKTANWQKK